MSPATVPDVVDPRRQAARAQRSKQLRTLGENVRKATAARNAGIVAASRAGDSLREIAQDVGLDHTAVRKILAREAEREDGR